MVFLQGHENKSNTIPSEGFQKVMRLVSINHYSARIYLLSQLRSTEPPRVCFVFVIIARLQSPEKNHWSVARIWRSLLTRKRALLFYEFRLFEPR